MRERLIRLSALIVINDYDINMLLRTLKRHRNGGARNDNKIDRHSHSKYRYNVVVFGTPSRTDASLVRSANKVIIPPVVKIVHKKKTYT